MIGFPQVVITVLVFVSTSSGAYRCLGTLSQATRIFAHCVAKVLTRISSHKSIDVDVGQDPYSNNKIPTNTIAPDCVCTQLYAASLEYLPSISHIPSMTSFQNSLVHMTESPWVFLVASRPIFAYDAGFTSRSFVQRSAVFAILCFYE